MSSLFHLLAYEPIYNLLMLLYSITQSFGFSIILLTILIRFALFPLYKKQISIQLKTQEIQPELKKIQERYKNDKEALARETMGLYKEKGVNPFSGCLPAIVQAFFMFGIFFSLRNASSGSIVSQDIYPFIPVPGNINTTFLDLDLSRGVDTSLFSSQGLFPAISANFSVLVLVFLMAYAQYYQLKMTLKKNSPEKEPRKEISDQEKPDFQEIMNKQSIVLFPLLALSFGFTLPAGLSLYWLTGTIFMIIQQKMLQQNKS